MLDFIMKKRLSMMVKGLDSNNFFNKEENVNSVSNDIKGKLLSYAKSRFVESKRCSYRKSSNIITGRHEIVLYKDGTMFIEEVTKIEPSSNNDELISVEFDVYRVRGYEDRITK